ncbi:hypothetical protein CA2559_10073 [Croceibacter atlanticus HTCC2559]|uniref:Uncharacterized protein n=1 Tax=Croceibacter atlanticus (strain ATCC BAA-628 / JCM 21780 / CIP 108009 / IAM 15332 / KCTC 12090 / HTCC2559) TaxID=216432 RepID=A3U987_CROAH|nr:hypothetical protein CA2559_10073 [Croceibacter atlanticus HTCC2559]
MVTPNNRLKYMILFFISVGYSLGLFLSFSFKLEIEEVASAKNSK